MSANLAKVVGSLRLSLEELLDQKGKVLFENVFSTRHIGRVMDFLLYESRSFIEKSGDPGFIEYRVRHILELSIFNGWSNYRRGEANKCVELEVGWDASRMIISAAFFADPTPDAIATGEGRIAKMARKIQELADGIVVRHEPKSGRIQVLAFVDAKSADKPSSAAVEYYDLDKAKEAEGVVDTPVTPKPLSAGSVDAFVADEKKSGGHEIPGSKISDLSSNSESDVVVNGGAEQQDEATVVGGTAAQENELTKVKGGADGVDDAETRIAGGSGEPDSGEARVGGADADLSDSTKMVVSGGAESESGDENIKVSGGPKLASDSEAIKIAGGAGAKEDSKNIKISRGPTIATDSTAIKVGGGVADAESAAGSTTTVGGSSESATAEANAASGPVITATDLKTVDKPVDLLVDAKDTAAEAALDQEEAEEGLQVLLTTVKSEVAPLCPSLNDTQFQEAFRAMAQKIRESYTQTLHHMLRVKNIQTITKVKQLKDQIKVLTERIDELNVEKLEMLESNVAGGSTDAATNVEVMKLRSAIATSETKAVQDEKKFRAEVEKHEKAIEKGDVPSGAQVWARNLMATILKDRALLNQKMHSVDAHLRKREHEFKTKETSFREQLRIKDESIKQKDFTIAKTKESLQTAGATIDQLRSVQSTGNVDKVELSNRVATAERLLSVSKENNEKIQKRLDEVQKKWQEEFSTRSEVQSHLSQAHREVEQMKKKVAELEGKKAAGEGAEKLAEERDKALRIADDLKKQNKELQTKVAQALAAQRGAQAAAAVAAKGGGAGGDAESKHKLDQASKLNKVMKDELDKLKKRFDDLKKEETKLRVEVSRLTEQLKAAGKTPVTGPGAPAKAPPSKPAAAGRSPLIRSKK